ncbi:hypothetical protein CEUSTIGMA_g13415.t1 [Chlamydomonas eustigma]|uniref:Uncharacterized protein n=1 Tax=Chlamydomonas eustigma TaxID=1157962 RepID=A0A250XSR5_9CHLO|nr:hypothetical protein CEUSTIGMA_g13415.t1 [Chlamydomonas eustigma]|eukprot:GAX85999.1 hypothetical protein CEUSTIGMA_g13415.t1 [Chlamydomonas eustigma]
MDMDVMENLFDESEDDDKEDYVNFDLQHGKEIGKKADARGSSSRNVLPSDTSEALPSTSGGHVTNKERVRVKVEEALAKVSKDAVDVLDGPLKSLVKTLRKLAYEFNSSMAEQQAGRAERFSQMQVRNESAIGDGAVYLGNVMAFAFRMVPSSGNEYLDIAYGLIVKISKAEEVKGGRIKQRAQTSISWEDEDATYLCRWYDAVIGSDGHAQRICGKKAFTMPINCPSGFNWEVKARDGMVLCPATLEWNEDNNVFLLDVDHEKQATKLALAAVTKDDGSREFEFVGSTQASQRLCKDDIAKGFGDDDDVDVVDDDGLHGAVSSKQPASVKRASRVKRIVDAKIKLRVK